MVARGVSKSGYLPDEPDFGEARPSWGAVPDRNTGSPATSLCHACEGKGAMCDSFRPTRSVHHGSPGNRAVTDHQGQESPYL